MLRPSEKDATYNDVPGRGNRECKGVSLNSFVCKTVLTKSCCWIIKGC